MELKESLYLQSSLLFDIGFTHQMNQNKTLTELKLLSNKWERGIHIVDTGHSSYFVFLCLKTVVEASRQW